ncbi:putative acetyl coenzyme A synthetase (ADP forming), alpha domain protein [delta proteobacterium NaphS2]|nr:putative acetyl coenzyme A synthetase (ADP forming), alpha domain protein [delta proteobacterium NaphS2]
MSIHHLEKIFRPNSVAVVGASERPDSIGRSVMSNLLQGGFKGDIIPINPKHQTLFGLKTHASILKMKRPVDLAVIATPIAGVPEIIRECVKCSVASAIVLSAGGKEIGEKGRELELRILKEAAKGGLRIIGPNCMGIVSSGVRLNASFASIMPLPGKMAFISQSGAICGAILDLSIQEGIGFSHFVSIGSMLDVDFGDLINYLGDDSDVKSIVLYIESLTNVRKFMGAARAISRVKPIVLLKSGRSRAGAAAASSHTGALAGEDAIYDAAFKRAGVQRVNTISELFDCAELMAKQPLPSGPGLGIITNGGGPGVMAADALSAFDLEPATLAPETLQKLDSVLPPFWSRSNPMDILGDAPPERWRQAMDIVLSAREIAALVIIFVPQSLSSGTAVSRAVSELVRSRPCPPIFAVWMGGQSIDEGRRILNKEGIPTYDTPERAIAAFVHLFAYKRNLELLQEIPPRLPRNLTFDRERAREIIRNVLKTGGAQLTEIESKNLFDAYGIPVVPTELAKNADQAVHLADHMGFPVAMKIHSRDITHKSDASGVQLNLRSEKDVRAAFDQIVQSAQAYNPEASIDGVAVQPMAGIHDYEVILGSKRDPLFGPVLIFGMGGIMTEILKDRAIALPPLNRLLARRIIESTKVYRMLAGYRNKPPARLDLLEEALIRLSQMVSDFPEIVELDINPMILQADRICAVDGRVRVAPSQVCAPQHLVISPYPNQYELTTTTRQGLNLFLRPIKPEDAPMLLALFESLSRESIYYRFFSPLKSLSHKMLVVFTQIDYDKDMGIVAMDAAEPEECLLGVARLIRKPGGTDAEFAVVVRDAFHGKGIGASLMRHLLFIAQKEGLTEVWGTILFQNTQMLKLARKIGFSMERDLHEDAYNVRIGLPRQKTL